jgi:cholesterol transport system auxiliary component
MTRDLAGARNGRRRLLACLAALSLASTMNACGLVGGPPPRQFTLHPVTGFPSGLAPVKWSLVVDEPSAPRQLDTSRIALMSGPFRVEYYADVEWTDDAPDMVQLLLIQSFQNTGRLPVVAPSRQTLATDFLLLSNLRKFQVEKDASGTPQADVVFEATLLRMPHRAPVASERFEQTTPISSESTEAVTQAFDASLGDVMRRVVDWTLQKGSAAPSAQGGRAFEHPGQRVGSSAGTTLTSIGAYCLSVSTASSTRSSVGAWTQSSVSPLRI